MKKIGIELPAIKHQVGSLNDLEEIVKVNRAAFQKTYDSAPYSLDYYKNKLGGKKPLIYLVRSDNKIIADSIAFEENDSFYVWILGVKEEFRRRGIASYLFELNEDYAKENDFSAITTKVYSVSEAMLNLLTKRGYNIIKYRNDEPDHRRGHFYYRLTKRLT